MVSQPKNIGHQRAGTKPDAPDDQYGEEETARRRDQVIRQMINTPPKPRSAAATGKAKERPASKGRVHKGKTRS
jgi:hypothetical protein